MPRTLSNLSARLLEQRKGVLPALGQHSEILREAGLGAEEVAALKATGAVR
jgi:hypothetical protein